MSLDGLGEERAEVFARMRGRAKQFTFLVEGPAVVKTSEI
jgi:hypothetical protein